MKKTTLAAALLLSAICGHVFAQPVTSGLNLHLVANSGFNANGAAAATWQDLSGAGNHVAAGNAGTAEPVYTVNAAGSGFDGIYFNGSSNYMFRSAAATTGFTPPAGTMFVVRIGNTADNTITSWFRTTLSIGANNSFNNEFAMMGDWAIHSTSSGNWLRRDHQCYSSLPNDKPVVLCGAVNSGVSASDVQFYVNGIQSTNAPVTQSSPVTLTTANRSIVVGGRYDGGGTATLQTNTWFSGYILEVLAYNRILTSAEIASVNEYLKCKYQVNYASCNVVPTCGGEPETCKDGCYWRVTGNNILNGENIFGTLSDDNIRIQTSGADRGIITSASNSNGFLGWNTMAPTARLHVNCDQGNDDGSGLSDVRFENLESGSGNILVIDNKGYVFDSKVPFDGKLRQAYEEEKAKVEKLESDMKALSDKLDLLMNQRGTVNTDIMGAADGSKLFQNTPNPFGKETTIEYYVAQMRQGAYIMIYDLNGRMLSRYTATQGKGSVKIDAENMAAGVYLYSLVIDGRETDSKRMIIAK